MSDSAKALWVKIHHHGCVACALTEKFPQVEMRTVNVKNVFDKFNNLKGYRVFVEISGDSRKDPEEFVRILKNDSKVREVRVFGGFGNSLFAFLDVKQNTSSYHEVVEKGGIYFDDVRMENGFDVHPILTSDFKELKSILNALEAVGELKITKIGSFKTKIKDSLLTEKQTSALQKALDNKYYSWPRKAKLETIAQKSNLSRRTYQEQLRKAESKLLPILLKDYLLSKKTKSS